MPFFSSGPAHPAGREPILQESVSLEVIGHIRTPFRQKFGIPRQAGLVAAPGVIEMVSPWDRAEFFEGLEQVSHLWVTYLFHQNLQQGWRGRVRPPRLGGNQRLGVFATRSPFRPNHLGLSVVRLLKMESRGGREVKLQVSGVDMLDGSPVLDIKPYLPYADAIMDAEVGFASDAPQARLNVAFAPSAERFLQTLDDGDELTRLIASLVALDPRPAYLAGRSREREHGMQIYGWNVRWRVDEGRQTAQITEITPAEAGQ